MEKTLRVTKSGGKAVGKKCGKSGKGGKEERGKKSQRKIVQKLTG
jgi:hypothetical protein